MRNGEVSYWWQARGVPPRRPSLPGAAEADVCIVGAGFTGLWTAYYLKRADPGLRIIVLEETFAGFGASGRNGGWVTAALPGSRSRYAQSVSGHPRGRDGVRELERHLRETVDEVARVCAAEDIDAGPGQGRHAVRRHLRGAGRPAAPAPGARTGLGRRTRDRSVSR